MEIKWQKSSYSTDSEGNCLEVAEQGDEILMRESDNPGLVVRTSRAKLLAFLQGAKDGEFDHLT